MSSVESRAIPPDPLRYGAQTVMNRGTLARLMVALEQSFILGSAGVHDPGLVITYVPYARPSDALSPTYARLAELGNIVIVACAASVQFFPDRIWRVAIDQGSAGRWALTLVSGGYASSVIAEGMVDPDPSTPPNEDASRLAVTRAFGRKSALEVARKQVNLLSPQLPRTIVDAAMNRIELSLAVPQTGEEHRLALVADQLFLAVEVTD